MKELLKLIPDLIKGIVELVESNQRESFQKVCEILLPKETLSSRVAYIVEEMKATEYFEKREKEKEDDGL